MVKGSFDNPVELRFPIGQLADGTSLNDVNFYTYTEASEVEWKIWAPLGLDRSLGRQRRQSGLCRKPEWVGRHGFLRASQHKPCHIICSCAFNRGY